MKLSIIIPCYNEEKTIAEVIAKVLTQDLGKWNKEIIVVDDCSRDATPERIKSFLDRIKYLRHNANQGKGAAIKTGLSQATGDAVIVQDADLEYDPADMRRLLEALGDRADLVVYGSRNLNPSRRGYSHYVIGSKLLDALVNLFFGTRLTDVYTCYKLFPAAIIKKINIASRGFELEMELTAKTLKMGYKITEVPIHYYPRKFSEGKKIRALDGLKGIWTLLKYRF
ncbi:MAG: glycosyltransferase family 2 protein [Candidatus Sungbacteria bacterium]|uniref:Glycosyltransferase family 2 protein n=1 Tax=Candidatus Sungiibacteriota bacterium TaxID=2750080 RepID=A0A931YD66_9BACT|nr:glycosyltransferase family 2 protein [Candidatus Sungbacteria bacterium]